MYTQWPSLWSQCFIKTPFCHSTKGHSEPTNKTAEKNNSNESMSPAGSTKSVCSPHEEGVHVAWLGSKYWVYCVLYMISSRENHLSFCPEKGPPVSLFSRVIIVSFNPDTTQALNWRLSVTKSSSLAIFPQRFHRV